MALQLNKVLIAGNLTRDPEVRFLASERAVANFGLACNRRYRTGDGEQKEETTFVDIEAWGRTAELVGQYLTKGRACMVEGRLKYDTWEDKEGQRRNRLKVVADNVQFLSDGGNREGGGNYGGGQSADQGGSAPAPSVPPADTGGMDDDPPF